MLRRQPAAILANLDARRICVIKPSALGDIVQTLPLLPVLRRRFPEATIDWVVSKPFADLLTDSPLIDRLRIFDRRGSWGSWWKLLGELRSAEYDLTFDLQGLLRSAVMTAATQARWRVGLETAREGSQLACNVIVPESSRDVPAWRRNWRVADELGLGDLPRETSVPLGEEHAQWATRKLSGLPQPIVAILPGAQWATKRWPIEKFAVVACKAMRAHRGSTVILGSPDEMGLAAQFQQLVRQLYPSGCVLNLTGHTTLRQLAAVLQRVQVVLANDSGPMHLAAGLGTPVVAVFTCTSPARSGPPGDGHALVATTVSCAGSYRKRCPHRGCRYMACLDELSTDRVWQALSRLLSAASSPSKAA